MMTQTRIKIYRDIISEPKGKTLHREVQKLGKRGNN